MKVRSDFVSNSSSSSFIIADYRGSFVNRHKLKKSDFVEAIIDLLGGKEAYDAYVAAHKSRYWDGNMFYIHDKSIKKDLEFINSDATEYLSEWKCYLLKRNPKTGKYTRTDGEHVTDFESIYEKLRDIYGLPYEYDMSNEAANKCRKYDRASGKYIHKDVPAHVKKVIHDLYDYYEVITNRDVLNADFARFLFHFGDNDIWSLKGAQEPGKNEDKWEDFDLQYAKDHNEAIDNSVWESESNTIWRVAEILFNWFNDHGKLKKLKKGETYEDLANDIVAATMHEG